MTNEVAMPMIPYNIPRMIIEDIRKIVDNVFPIRTIWFFSIDKNFEWNIVVILIGKSDKLIIRITSVDSTYSGKTKGSISGIIKNPTNVNTIPRIIKKFLTCLISSPEDSWGTRYLKSIDVPIIIIEIICKDKE